MIRSGFWAHKPKSVLNKLILTGGPPRSGTTILAKTLNAHPRIVTMIDDLVYECWALYYYRNRTGLIDDIRQGRTDPEQAGLTLWRHLVRRKRLYGVAPSEKTAGLALAKPPERPDGELPNHQDLILERYVMPLAELDRLQYICLKSPELSFHLPEMAQLFPAARLVISYRPVIEIAESMFRKGLTVTDVRVFWARWQEETDDRGVLRAPPGVLPRWQALWPDVSDFDRCAIYAASYLWAIATGLAQLPRERYLLYDHSLFRRRPQQVLPLLADFLDINEEGFASTYTRISKARPDVPRDMLGRLDALREVLALDDLDRRLQDLSRCGSR